jgi:hypothetical protein
MVRMATVAELVGWCVQHDLDPREVSVTAPHLTWDAPETPAEIEWHLLQRHLDAKYGAHLWAD